VGPRILLLLIAVVCFVVAAFGTNSLGPANLTGIGLAAFAASFIFP
jgi:hypothetical protein